MLHELSKTTGWKYWKQLECNTSSSARETAQRTSYFDSQNCEVEFLSHPFGGLRGNVDVSCVHRWKKRRRLPIGDNWTF